MNFINDHLQIRDSKSNLNLLIQNSVALENIREEESISQQSEEYDLQEGELIYASSSSDERLNGRRNAQDEITPSKKIKRGKTNSEVEVFQLASNILAKLSSAIGSTNERTDDDIYGEDVASRLKNITNKRAKLKLKNQIDQLLFQTEMEVVE